MLFKLFALPFLCIGLYGLIGPFVPGSGATVEKMLGIPLLVGLPFAAFGAWAWLYSHAIEINGDTRTITEWWSVWYRWKSQEHSFSEFRQIELNETLVVRKRGPATTVYPVCFTGRGKEFCLPSRGSYQDGRQLAEHLSRLCGPRLADDTSGAVTVRQADELDVSLRERVQRQGLGQIPGLPRPPEKFKSKILFSGGELKMDIPMHWSAIKFSVPGCLVNAEQLGHCTSGGASNRPRQVQCPQLAPPQLLRNGAREAREAAKEEGS